METWFHSSFRKFDKNNLKELKMAVLHQNTRNIQRELLPCHSYMFSYEIFSTIWIKWHGDLPHSPFGEPSKRYGSFVCCRVKKRMAQSCYLAKLSLGNPPFFSISEFTDTDFPASIFTFPFSSWISYIDESNFSFYFSAYFNLWTYMCSFSLYFLHLDLFSFTTQTFPVSKNQTLLFSFSIYFNPWIYLIMLIIPFFHYFIIFNLYTFPFQRLHFLHQRIKHAFLSVFWIKLNLYLWFSFSLWLVCYHFPFLRLHSLYHSIILRNSIHGHIKTLPLFFLYFEFYFPLFRLFTLSSTLGFLVSTNQDISGSSFFFPFCSNSSTHQIYIPHFAHFYQSLNMLSNEHEHLFLKFSLSIFSVT